MEVGVGGDRGVRAMAVTKPDEGPATILLRPMAGYIVRAQEQSLGIAMNVTIITEDAIIAA